MQRRIPVISTIVVVAAAATMVALGVWQLGRAEEKAALIARYEANLAASPVRLERPLDAPDNLYRQVTMDCPRPFGWTAIAGRSASGQLGYAQRYVCQNESVHSGIGESPLLQVYAVIGWSRSPEMVVWRGGTVSGILAPLGEDFKIVAEPPLADLEANATPDPSGLPNNHLAYAGQWFFFALTALVIYWLALRRRWREQG